MNKVLTFCFLLLVFIFSLSTETLAAGRWVEHTLDDFSSGTALRDRDEGCLVYTRENADVILIFDISTGEWLRVELEAPQDFQDAETKGQVVFAWSDNLLFGYSAILQQWDTLTYTGDFMSGSQYYTDCSNKLACLVTKSYMYVFDAELGYWQSYDYGLPVDFTGGSVWAQDTYIGMNLAIPSPGEPKNVVYSGITHGFNQIELGVGKSAYLLNYGFAEKFNVDADAKTFRLVGYSAFNNQFDVVTYICGEDEAPSSSTGAGSLPVDMLTNRLFGFRNVDSYVSEEGNWYGFDTRQGSWDHEYHYYDWGVDNYLGYVCQAGQFSYDRSSYSADGSLHFVFYSGIDGVFRDYNPGQVYKSTTTSWGGGGTVFFVRDSLSAWGYDVAGDRGSLLDLPLAKTTSTKCGEDFVALTRYEEDVDTMITYFYNGTNNRWSSVSAPDHHSDGATGLAHVYIQKGSTDNVVVFYSADNDSIIKEDFPDDISVYVRVKGMMGSARSAGQSILFDGVSAKSFPYGFDFLSSSIGTHSAILNDDASNIVYGYSSLTGNESQQSIDFDPYYVIDSSYIGYIANAYNMTKCYAYNGLRDGWVELIPEGSNVTALVGTKTIMVERSDRVYAFDPEGDPTAVDDDNPLVALPQVLTLSQNFPNPFNPVTKIAFTLPRDADVKLEIFDILGRSVTTLVEERLVAGEHEKEWDGKNNDGQPVASGIYFYRITTDTDTSVKKMLLLK